MSNWLNNLEVALPIGMTNWNDHSYPRTLIGITNFIGHTTLGMGRLAWILLDEWLLRGFLMAEHHRGVPLLQELLLYGLELLDFDYWGLALRLFNFLECHKFVKS